MEYTYYNSFVDTFTYGVVKRDAKLDTLITEALDTPIQNQPYIQEQDLLLWRNKIRSVAQDRNNVNSDTEVKDVIRSFESTRFNKVIHLMKSNSIQNRFIDFWSNHLCISDAGSKLVMLPFLAQYEASVIGSHIFSKYEDMLYSSATSAAMLLYLNNNQNVDPNSNAAKRFGLNENYARELLELHSMSISSKYTQEDVTNIAYLLTGWTINFRSKDPKVLFIENRSSKRKISFMGRQFESGSSESLRDLIVFLARHPKTAENITGKLFRFFISDEIDKNFHKKLIDIWLKTNGDLKAVSYALLKYDGLLSYKKSKFRSPQEWTFLISVLASNLLSESVDYFDMGNFDLKKGSPLQRVSLWANKAMKDMGQILWGAPSPKGWDISDQGWLSADSISTKLDFSYQLSDYKLGKTMSGVMDDDWVKDYFPFVSDRTNNILKNADPHLRLSLFLISPEILRR